jgi:hypothetical protein
MTISKDLFLAILSMDAYNRGYGAGISDGGENDPDGLGGIESHIGGATIVNQSNVAANSDAVNAGFYAIAYDWNGETVISYRGTDNPDFFGTAPGASDVWHGWVTGAGVQGSQSELAFKFFKDVTGADALQREAGSAILTGHSLSGVLLTPEVFA